MFALSKLSKFAAVGTLVVLGGFSPPARADDFWRKSGTGRNLKSPFSRRLAARASSLSTSQKTAIVLFKSSCGTGTMRAVARWLAFGSA